MKWFSRKPAPITSVPDEWIVAEANAPDNRPLVLRILSAGWDIAGHPDYPLRLGTAVPIKSPEELSRANDPKSPLALFEDRASTFLQKDLLAVHVLTITALEGDLFRELVFYAKNDPRVAERLDRVKSSFAPLGVTVYAEGDPEGDLFRSLCGKRPPR